MSVASFWGRFAAHKNHKSGPSLERENPMATVTKIPNAGQAPAGTVTWFNDAVERAKYGVISEVITVTPGLASVLLGRNENNRHIKHVKAAQYSADMSAGRWVFNGEPIIISDTGELNDGQHRMQALIDANITLPFLFVFGLSRDSRETVDQGAARGAGDYLSMGGMTNAVTVGTIARLVLAYERSDYQNIETRYITNTEVVLRARNDPSIGESAHFGVCAGHRSTQYVAGTILGFCHYVFSQISAPDAEEFLTQVATGEGLKAGSSAIAVRDRLLAVGKGRTPKVAILFRGWNFHRRGMKVRTSSLPATMPLPALI